MDSTVPPPTSHQRTSLGSSSMVSPAPSMYSRVHSSRSSVSSTSMTSSPVPAQDSFDLYGSMKRLEDVREEPQEREEDWNWTDREVKYSGEYLQREPFDDAAQTHGAIDFATIAYGTSPTQMEYSLGDQDAWSTTSSGHRHAKRQRSLDNRDSITDRVASRFSSLSRRWKNRSSIGPQLTIITNGAVAQRSSSATSFHIISPALSAISQHESHLPSSPVTVSMDEGLHESAVVPLFMDHTTMTEPDEDEQEHDQGQATTPLLPPTIADLSKKRDGPLQSPLQSPSIAATPCMGGSQVSVDIAAAAATLPSPPLSTRPSMASIHRGRGETISATLPAEIPPLSLHEDPWDSRLGHANFSIHPEPYQPDKFDIDSYIEFRANWSLARKQYAQHIARTVEHYGNTSRVYKLTQEKWDEIDNTWKRQDTILSRELSTDLARLSDDDVGSPALSSSPNFLDKPMTRVVVPQLGQRGKFPEMGDADIVGPLAVAPARAPELQRSPPGSPLTSPKKRNLFKYLSDVLGRHGAVR